MTVQLLAVAGLVLLSGFFSGSETALYRAHWVRLTNWTERRTPGAGLSLRLLRWREASVIAVLVGNNLVNVFATVVASALTVRVFGPGYTLVAVLLLVALTLVFGEYIPKAVAQENPNHWLRRASAPLAGAMVLFAPAVAVLAGINRLVAPVKGGRERQPLTRQDLLSALRQRERRAGADAGTTASNLAARLFRFSGLALTEAAIPLARVKSMPEGATRPEFLEFIDRYGFSRIPVHRDRAVPAGKTEPGKDHPRADITGVVFAKDLLEPGPPRVRAIRRISVRARMMEVLNQMQKRGEHIAVVEDDRRTIGIVTLEDILEELVGEIRSED